MKKAIELESLQVIKEGKLLLDIPDFQVYQGGVLGIMGPNGAGKSTLLKVLSLLETPSQGTITFWGKTISNGQSPLHLRRRLAAVFQEPLLLNGSVWDNVALGLKLRKIPQFLLQEKVKYWLAKLSISHLANRQVRTLSGGEAQRTSIARAMILEPEILFLDEPLAALDAPTKANLLEELAEILQTLKITTVFVTHDYTELPFLADRAVILYQGRILQQGQTWEIINNPGSSTAASLVGVDNILPGSTGNRAGGETEFYVTHSEIKLFGTVKGRANQAAFALLRADDIELDALPSPEWNAVNGTIKRIVPQGTQVKLIINCGFPLIAAIPQKKFFRNRYNPGDRVTAVFDPAKMLIVER